MGRYIPAFLEGISEKVNATGKARSWTQLFDSTFGADDRYAAFPKDSQIVLIIIKLYSRVIAFKIVYEISFGVRLKEMEILLLHFKSIWNVVMNYC